jgi:hypothetical protein
METLLGHIPNRNMTNVPLMNIRTHCGWWLNPPPVDNRATGEFPHLGRGCGISAPSKTVLAWNGFAVSLLFP